MDLVFYHSCVGKVLRKLFNCLSAIPHNRTEATKNDAEETKNDTEAEKSFHA